MIWTWISTKMDEWINRFAIKIKEGRGLIFQFGFVKITKEIYTYNQHYCLWQDRKIFKTVVNDISSFKYLLNHFSRPADTLIMQPGQKTGHRSENVCVWFRSLQHSDRVDVEMIEEVCVGRSSIRTLVLHQVALQCLLAGVALLHHPKLRKKDSGIISQQLL